MKFQISILATMMLLLMAFVLPQQVWACACCADDGEYGISFSRPTAYQLDLLRQIRFSETTTLFTNAAGFEAVRGLVNPKESYAFNGSFNGSRESGFSRWQASRHAQLATARPHVELSRRHS